MSYELKANTMGLYLDNEICIMCKIKIQVNHFPKSIEITRKDLMNRNISKMQIRCGISNFNFVPKTYILPSEQSLLVDDYEKNKTTK